MRSKPSAKRVAHRFVREAAVNPYLPRDLAERADEILGHLNQAYLLAKKFGDDMSDVFDGVEDAYHDAKDAWVERTGGHPDDFAEKDEGVEWDLALTSAEALSEGFDKNQSKSFTSGLLTLLADLEDVPVQLKAGKRPW